MKFPTLFSLCLLSTVSLTSCYPQKTSTNRATTNATTKNVVYLHEAITRDADARSTFNRYIGSGNVVVDYYADWCGPCKMMARVIDQIAGQFPNVTFLKVDTDRFQSIASGVRSIPTLVLYKNGSQLTRLSGSRDKSAFVSLLNKYF